MASTGSGVVCRAFTVAKGSDTGAGKGGAWSSAKKSRRAHCEVESSVCLQEVLDSPFFFLQRSFVNHFHVTAVEDTQRMFQKLNKVTVCTSGTRRTMESSEREVSVRNSKMTALSLPLLDDIPLPPSAYHRRTYNLTELQRNSEQIESHFDNASLYAKPHLCCWI